MSLNGAVTTEETPLVRKCFDDGSLQCPYCQENLLHPCEVEVNAGGQITIIDDKGTRMRAGEPAGRGVRIELAFDCENGHSFRLAFQFHKGSTGLECFDNPQVFFCGTIWRD